MSYLAKEQKLALKLKAVKCSYPLITTGLWNMFGGEKGGECLQHWKAIAKALTIHASRAYSAY